MSLLEKRFGARLHRNEPLSKYTAARLGGPADMLFVAKRSAEELAEIVQLAWAADVPLRIIGGGANILVADDGVRGLVVINRVSEINFGEWHDGRTVNATSGVNLSTLAQKAAAHGLSGFEWAVSVPGTLGGAIVNNAGAHGGEMSASVCDVVVVDAELGPRMLYHHELAYDYRTSSLKARNDRRFLVLMANLALPPGDPEAIRQKMAENTAYRKKTQPPGASLGSIFKNPPGDYAGRLIEQAGLKGHRIGAAQVSEMHANWFINAGAATARDYYALLQYVQATVAERTGVQLEPEIEFVGTMF